MAGLAHLRTPRLEAVALTETLGALREREFRLLWVGQATSLLGDALVPVALAFAVLDLTGSASDLGFVLAAHVAPLVALVLVGGVWADRLPRQLVMLTSDVARCAVQATIAVLLLTGAAELWHLLVLAVLFGSAEAFFQPASTGLVPATVSAARLQQANAVLGLSRSAAFIAGPALAGVIVAAAEPGVAFAIDAGTFVISAVSLAAMRPRPMLRQARVSFLAELGAGWRDFTSRTWLWATVLWATTDLFLVMAPVNVLGPVVAKESLGGAKAWGLIMAASAVGALGGGAVALRWKPERPMLVCSLGILLTAPTPALLAMTAPAAVIAAAQLCSGMAAGFFIAVWATTLQQHVPPDKLSRVSAYDWMGSLAFVPLGYVLAGPVSEVIGVSATLWISAGWVVASTVTVLLVPGVRELRRLEGETPPEVALATGDATSPLYGSEPR